MAVAAAARVLVLASGQVACEPAAQSRVDAPRLVSVGGRAGGGQHECAGSRSVVWRGGFESPDWLSTWGTESKFVMGAGNVEVVGDAQFGKVLRVHYPAGSSSSSFAREGHPLGGAEFKVKLPGGDQAQSIFISYAVRFAPGFPWVRGGKLPGICGGTCPSGGALVTGYGGWSVRAMWRRNGAGELYAYILPPQAYGTELGLGTWTFLAGDWHRLAEELILNSNGQPNGVARVWYDADPSGAPTFEVTGLTFRSDATPANTLLFSTFFGGHDASWATPIDTYVDFARFVMCR